VWRDREVRLTHRKRSSGPRTCRTRADQFEVVWRQVQQWLNKQPDANAKDLFLRPQKRMPGAFRLGNCGLSTEELNSGSQIARQLLFGLESGPVLEHELCAGAAAAFEEVRP
jgi:hypothetical protein